MKVTFEMNDGTKTTTDVTHNLVLDDDLFTALMNIIEEETGNYEDMDRAIRVTITMD